MWGNRPHGADPLPRTEDYCFRARDEQSELESSLT